MYREIKKKKLILDNRKPYSKEITKYLAELDVVDLAYTSFRLSGSSLTRNDITKIYRGEIITSAGLNEHARIEAYKNVLKEMNILAGRRYKLSEEVIVRLYRALTGKNPEPREGNPVIYEWSYNPPHWSEVGMRMDEMLERANTERPGMTNYVLRASEIHNEFLAIYPLTDENEEMARLLFYYYLMIKKYSVFTLGFNEIEYNSSITKYLQDGDISRFSDMAERSLYERLEIMLQITAKK
ncbi:MAG: Fic family protein [Eubacteriales bacterium]|nr:Fic family protein [Eubacteriales bacterium]